MRTSLSITYKPTLEDGKVSYLFRCAILCPVHKNGCKIDPEN